MELYQEVRNEKKTKLPMIIGICISVLIIIIITIIFGIIYLEKSIMKITIDGQRNYDIEKVIYITEENEPKLYFQIREIAKFLNYEDYRGDYKIKSEDSTKCYVKNEYETAMFTKDSDILIRSRGDSDYEYITLDEKVFEKDGELYTTPEGIEQAFSTLLEYDLEKNRIDIYTMDYLNKLYASALGIDIEDKNATETLSEEFADKKAIFQDMMIIIKDDQYGVIKASTGSSILETKYEEIKYLPATSDFLVKSNEKYGIIGKDASTKVKVVYDEIKVMDSKNELYLVKQNDLYGVIDTNGKIIIEPAYKQIGVDIEKYEQIGIENQYVLLDEIIPIKNNENLWGLFNIKGEKIKEFEFTGIGCATTQSSNLYPALVIPSYKILVVEKDKHYNLITSSGEELIPSYILDSVYMKSNTETGENKFYMTYNGNDKVVSVEEWLTSIGR